jgi:hypothetical protein
MRTFKAHTGFGPARPARTRMDARLPPQFLELNVEVAASVLAGTNPRTRLRLLGGGQLRQKLAVELHRLRRSGAEGFDLLEL